MPELPEVETVRAGLAAIVTGRRIEQVTVLHARPVRRHVGGPGDFAAALAGRTFDDPRRRGKYLWLPFTDGDALLAHLGMSGQFRLDAADAPLLPNTRVLFDLAPPPVGPLDTTVAPSLNQLRFVDQRMFGGLSLSPGGADLPAELAHIGRDLFDPDFDTASVVARIRRKRSGIKRVLLDQTVTSGIGNIYADEALWRVKLHYDTAADSLRPARIRELLDAARTVMAEALAQGGTSFDSLYVNVNGSSGYFGRALAVYGREGLPCLRCGRAIVREAFMNRSSFRCPSCQRRPRAATYRVPG
ncbi:bifunctional DNA-formamidopyrimidine glycosylase/DNA-(apurinic or apyrimidinic site) lyase [Micropruina sonneratiae]|uniref:bifunctional DNA-formamidopyrimidine glycosylase/DNA-(apurinic or apyrimidinic site) lyase n=1 Tax=Micropruina sonneratiae TaxID=2986940 RepID=UPI002225BC16|nr:bifunctional DNA-formamidopyrimidine glycosylase/DNA-(apurinic or apyrimidinic site) lyase [Micropruina sp. KQZ13P-5]MCW3157342.1 bifunctional DNA-formamidopyrimidine glycosylase/DNA-(apurinic or apyrimidinic site) lyase [Micropruina sp. KQZ13P-5]